jgi:hypothetical protein
VCCGVKCDSQAIYTLITILYDRSKGQWQAHVRAVKYCRCQKSSCSNHLSLRKITSGTLDNSQNTLSQSRKAHTVTYVKNRVMGSDAYSFPTLYIRLHTHPKTLHQTDEHKNAHVYLRTTAYFVLSERQRFEQVVHFVSFDCSNWPVAYDRQIHVHETALTSSQFPVFSIAFTVARFDFQKENIKR